MASLEGVLPEIIKSLKSTYGDDFFNEITLQLNKIIGTDYTFIAQVDADNSLAKTISLAVKGQLAENFEYELINTPCEDVAGDSVCVYPKNICSLFPKDQLLKDMNIEGYVGVPLHDSFGKVKGIIVALHEAEIKDIDLAITLFELFSGRIAAEIERAEQKRNLEQLNKVLDAKVKELTESEKRLSIHLQNTPLGCISWDKDFHCTEWNKAAEKIFGYSASEAIGRHAEELIIPTEVRDDISDIYKSLLEQKGGTRSTNDNTTKHGKTINCDWYNTPIIDENGVVIGVASLVQDITERVQQEALVRRSQKMDALGKLTGGIAHDQNNILGVILGYAELLSLKLKEQPEPLHYAEQIQRACKRSAQLIGKLLSFSRKNSLSTSKLNINTLLLEQQDMLQKTLTVRIKLLLKLSEDIWPVWLDQNDLEDSILNLCINAMHSISDINSSGQITISTCNAELSHSDAKIIGINAGEYVVLSIADNGCGIEAKIKEKIFDPFFSTKGDGGTGLGLSQVFSFVNRSQGCIKVNSKVGHGSQFLLYFPRYKNNIDKGGVTQAVNTVSLKGAETILVVDDEQSLKNLCSELLTLQGYKVFTADGHVQALDILRNENVDLMISDVIMPEMNGYELSKIVKQRYPLIKIQLASGFVNEQNVEGIDESLQKNLLPKPYNSETLYKKVRNLLDE